jgi:hypothetical protein
MKRKAAVTVLAVAVATAALATAGASARPTAGVRVDVSSATAAKSYLRSIGVNPASIVIQRGLRNYAGPNCPGRGWTCSTATRVIQVARDGGQNSFECEAGAGTAGGARSTCVITQANAAGNTARCSIRSTDDASVAQSCTITQTSGSGDNRAFVEMVVRQGEGASQSATQAARVTQTSETGKNDLHTIQKVDQDAKRHGGTVEQQQEAALSLVVDQTSGSGNQLVQMHQSLDQDAKAMGAVLGGSQSQLGDLFGDIDQTSTGRSQIHARQDEDQREQAPKGAAVAQSQIGPATCCTRQVGNANNRFDINQSASQSASEQSAFQSEVINGSCISSGLCDVDQSARNNVDRERNSCRAPVCFIFIVCRSGEDGPAKRALSVLWHERGCESGSRKPPHGASAAFRR